MESNRESRYQENEPCPLEEAPYKPRETFLVFSAVNKGLFLFFSLFLFFICGNKALRASLLLWDGTVGPVESSQGKTTDDASVKIGMSQVLCHVPFCVWVCGVPATVT